LSEDVDFTTICFPSSTSSPSFAIVRDPSYADIFVTILAKSCVIPKAKQESSSADDIRRNRRPAAPTPSLHPPHIKNILPLVGGEAKESFKTYLNSLINSLTFNALLACKITFEGKGTSLSGDAIYHRPKLLQHPSGTSASTAAPGEFFNPLNPIGLIAMPSPPPQNTLASTKKHCTKTSQSLGYVNAKLFLQSIFNGGVKIYNFEACRVELLVWVLNTPTVGNVKEGGVWRGARISILL
jgi:hypothetical protein